MEHFGVALCEVLELLELEDELELELEDELELELSV